MKKQTNHNDAQKRSGAPAKKTSQPENRKQEAKQAAKSIDTANKDQNDVDRKSGM